MSKHRKERRRTALLLSVGPEAQLPATVQEFPLSAVRGEAANLPRAIVGLLPSYLSPIPSCVFTHHKYFILFREPK